MVRVVRFRASPKVAVLGAISLYSILRLRFSLATFFIIENRFLLSYKINSASQILTFLKIMYFLS